MLDGPADIHNSMAMTKLELQKKLVDACYSGHLAKTALLLAHGAKPNEADERGYSPIHFACQEGHVKIINLLVQRGASFNVRDCEGDLPLFSAVGPG